MVAEGSVLSARREPVGAAVNVAPDGFAHPVYRAGFSLSLKLPSFKEIPLESSSVETTPPDSPSEVEKEQAAGIEEVPAAQEVQEEKEPVSEASKEESERPDHEL